MCWASKYFRTGRDKNPAARSKPDSPSSNWPVRPITALMSIFLVLFVSVAPGCIVIHSACVGNVSSDCDSIVTGPDVRNPRFQFPQQSGTAPALLPSHDFWLPQGDGLEARWDSYTLFLTAPDATCDPMVQPSPPDCAKCDLVNLVPNQCNSVFVPTSNFDLLTLFAFAGFTSSSDPVVIASLDVAGTIPGLASFTPTVSGTYQLKSLGALNNLDQRQTLAEARVFITSEGMSPRFFYELRPLQQNVANVVFYSGPVTTDPVLSDNFSRSLQIGKVRILKGKATADPASGKFMLKDVSVVRPSRIVIIPNYAGDSVFAHDGNRCYAQYSPQNEDGDLDLTRCRSAPNSSTTNLLEATPVYLKTNVQAQLTWVAEFNPAEGGVVPSLAGDEVLAIEFTLR